MPEAGRQKHAYDQKLQRQSDDIPEIHPRSQTHEDKTVPYGRLLQGSDIGICRIPPEREQIQRDDKPSCHSHQRLPVLCLRHRCRVSGPGTVRQPYSDLQAAEGGKGMPGRYRPEDDVRGSEEDQDRHPEHHDHGSPL